MWFHAGKHRLSWIIAALCLFLWPLCGCSIVGPTSITRGRADYNEAISRTGDQQMLMAIVRNRYGETTSMLAVTSVTANISVTTQAGVNIGAGSKENYAGNLVPFSAGAVYEENPTISYAPAQGLKYMRQMMSPVPLDLMVMVIRSVTRPGLPLTLLVSSVNDLKNPDFLTLPATEPDPRFTHFIDLFTYLEKAGLLLWVKDPGKDIEFSIVIRKFAPTYSEKVHKLLALLGLQVPTNESGDIVLPVSLAVEAAGLEDIAITTRSVFDLVEILSASIDVPEDHAGSGLAISYPPKGLAGKDIHIRSARVKPKNASVAVKYQESWFYIEETDQATKEGFQLVKGLWHVGIANAASQFQPAPILTVPVSR